MTQTLATMKARIAREVRRPNIPDDIADAISTAIQAYQSERLYFNTARFSFPTVANQEFYTKTDAAGIGNIIKIDYIKLYQGALPYSLEPMSPAHIEQVSANGTSTGQPLYYCLYAQELRLYPIPNDVFTVRIGCQSKIAAPATDTEADNPWMCDAERLVRSRAKWELAVHRTLDQSLATLMSAAIDEALGELHIKTNKMQQQGDWSVTPTQF